MADEAEEFWAAFEKETGEKVLARSIGEIYERQSDMGIWGLLVLTDASFRFKHMPNDNWLVSLFRGSSRKSGQPLKDDIVIRRDALLSVDTPERNLFTKLFGPAFPRFSVRSRGEGEDMTYVFSADPTTGLVKALKEAVPGA
jgi:hypothetical protein